MKALNYLLVGLALVGCSKNTTTEKDVTEETPKQVSELMEKARNFFKSVSTLAPEAIPNEKIELGKKLYFETKLSKEGNISCNSCHRLDGFGVDNLPTSPGDAGKLGVRNSPTVIYASLHTMQFWDGRAKDVEAQAEGPILNPVEHNIPSAEFLENRLREIPEYQELFKKAFPNDAQPITFKNIANAIGAFERQFNPVSRFDKYLDGDDSALTQQEKDGLQTYINTGCITCHSGIAVGGQMFQKFGVFDEYQKYTKSKKVDLGLADISKKDTDKFMFKVPGLRNVEKTAPYFHDGSVQKLEDAVRIMAKVQLNKDLKNKEVTDIVAFLKTLTADIDAKYKK